MISMNELMRDDIIAGLSRDLLDKGLRSLWPFIFDREDTRKHNECLKIAKANKVSEWLIDDYSIANTGSSVGRYQPVLKYVGNPRDQWQQDITSMIIFKDQDKRSLWNVILDTVYIVTGKEDALKSTEVGNFYIDYLNLLHEYMTVEAAYASLAAINFGSKGARTKKGEDIHSIDMSSLLVLIGMSIDGMTKLCDPASSGGFRNVWNWTLNEEVVYSSLRHYKAAQFKDGIYRMSDKEVWRYKRGTEIIEHKRGPFSTSEIAYANALIMLHDLNKQGIDVSYDIPDRVFTLAKGKFDTLGDIAYLS